MISVCVCSWGSGADLWGSEVDGRYGKPSIDDGLLEVVGVTGVVHMVRHILIFIFLFFLFICFHIEKKYNYYKNVK